MGYWLWAGTALSEALHNDNYALAHMLLDARADAICTSLHADEEATRCLACVIYTAYQVIFDETTRAIRI